MKQKHGQRCEQYATTAVRQWLIDNGLDSKLVPVSEREDINGTDIKNSEGLSFQVKHQKLGGKTGNFSFELVEKAISDGYLRPGNHWHEFDYYVYSVDCRTFYIFPPVVIDELVFEVDDHKFELNENGWTDTTRLVWNRSDTVNRSAREWNNGGRKWTAQNLLVKISALAAHPEVTVVRGKIL